MLRFEQLKLAYFEKNSENQLHSKKKIKINKRKKLSKKHNVIFLNLIFEWHVQISQVREKAIHSPYYFKRNVHHFNNFSPHLHTHTEVREEGEQKDPSCKRWNH